MWRLLAVVLFVCAVPFGLLFVDVLVTKIASGDVFSYVAMVLWGGAAAGLAFAARSCLHRAELEHP